MNPQQLLGAIFAAQLRDDHQAEQIILDQATGAELRAALHYATDLMTQEAIRTRGRENSAQLVADNLAHLAVHSD